MTELAEGQRQALPAPVSLIMQVLGIRRDEIAAVAWSFLYFFCILSAYYMLRSVRESMAIVSGVQPKRFSRFHLSMSAPLASRNATTLGRFL